jgi:hypothetical protein
MKRPVSKSGLLSGNPALPDCLCFALAPFNPGFKNQGFSGRVYKKASNRIEFSRISTLQPKTQETLRIGRPSQKGTHLLYYEYYG